MGDRRFRTGNHCSLAGDVPVTDAPLKSKQMEVINMRLDFMAMVLTVLARSLPPREAAHALQVIGERAVSYTHLRAHETVLDLVCRLLLEKKHSTQ